MSQSYHRLVVVTPTGDRPWAFSLCVHYMNRQTRKPDEWIVVDDGHTDAASESLKLCKIKYTHIRLKPQKGNTVTRNIREGLSRCSSDDYVVVMEDDDWYPDKYLETMYVLFNDGDYVYYKNHWYYNIKNNIYKEFSLNRGSNCGIGVTGKALEEYMSSLDGTHQYGDTYFGKTYAGTRVENSVCGPLHIVGHSDPRPGSISWNRSTEKDSGWTKDDREFGHLISRIGIDAFRYVSAARGMPVSTPFQRIFILSNVPTSYSTVKPREDDLLVFLNTGKNLHKFKDIKNKILYHRSPKPQYGNEVLECSNRYVFDSGDTAIPKRFIKHLKDRYDWNYSIEESAVKSMTTGYMVTKWMEYLYPDSEIILVNFGYSVKNSTYRCPWHNWKFEDEDLKKFKHIYTEDKKSVSTVSHRIYSPPQKILYITDDSLPNNLCATAVSSSYAVSGKYYINVSCPDRFNSLWKGVHSLDRTITKDSADIILYYKELGNSEDRIDRAFSGIEFDLGDAGRRHYKSPPVVLGENTGKEYQCPYAGITPDITEDVVTHLKNKHPEVKILTIDYSKDSIHVGGNEVSIMEVLYIVKGASWVVCSSGDIAEISKVYHTPVLVVDAILNMTPADVERDLKSVLSEQ